MNVTHQNKLNNVNGTLCAGQWLVWIPEEEQYEGPFEESEDAEEFARNYNMNNEPGNGERVSQNLQARVEQIKEDDENALESIDCVRV